MATDINNAAYWYVYDNPLVQTDATTPFTTIHLTGEAQFEYFSVTVGVGETITVDTDFATFDTEIKIGRLDGNGDFVELAQNDDDQSDGVDDAVYNATNNGSASGNNRESYVSYTADVATAGAIIIRIEQYNDTVISTGSETLVHVSVTGHAATGNAADFASGIDTLIGQNGDDDLYGLDGNDVLEGGAGDDYLNGGNGVDTIRYSDSSEGVTVDLVAGTATRGDGAGGTETDTLVSIEDIEGSGGSDTLTGNDADNNLASFGGDDTL